MSEPQKEEKTALTDRSESLPVECGAAGNQQSCLITGLCPLLAELSSTLQSLKASMDQGQFRRKGTVRTGSHITHFCFEKHETCEVEWGKNTRLQDAKLNKKNNTKLA